ncbi:unnamed protein product [Mytilus coruscus]|uniref:Endonuclease/exonuclease/phosphatase domain-containing protein n=1 Tax=Mytilus coruscus TaxID=42192 RepID=A0A6J8AN05_MYTCO|nr:unnamed protein product [Mytilus coruscus]
MCEKIITKLEDIDQIKSEVHKITQSVEKIDCVSANENYKENKAQNLMNNEKLAENYKEIQKVKFQGIEICKTVDSLNIKTTNIEQKVQEIKEEINPQIKEMNQNVHVENSELKQLENSTKEIKEKILEEINRNFMDLRIGIKTNFKTLERIQELDMIKNIQVLTTMAIQYGQIMTRIEEGTIKEIHMEIRVTDRTNHLFYKNYLNMGTHENRRSLTISAWNVRGLGDKIQDELFIDKIQSDINILLETWKGECKDYKILSYNTISKIRKKKKKNARRHSGGIIVYYKKEIAKGITNINGTKSQNRLWLKLEKEFFGFKEDLYLCAIYVPPINSNYFENDYNLLENEISTYARQGRILLMGDMNARTGKCPDFITGDSCQINNFDAENLIPDYYEVDTEIARNNQDNVTNVQGKSLLELCTASRLRILNGRFIMDSLGYYTYMSINGYSAVDYALISESLLSSVKYFKTDDFTL